MSIHQNDNSQLAAFLTVLLFAFGSLTAWCIESPHHMQGPTKFIAIGLTCFLLGTGLRLIARWHSGKNWKTNHPMIAFWVSVPFCGGIVTVLVGIFQLISGG